MKRLDVNLGLVLPKLATILPLAVIALNVLVNIIQGNPFSNREYIWSTFGLLAAIYFGVFSTEIKM